MYSPASFRVGDPAAAAQLIGRHGFGVLVSPGAEAGALPLVTHVPMRLWCNQAGEDVLIGHVARANPHWREWDGKRESLAIFSGDHAYVSPRWYATVGEVPTWNYEAVHVSGPVSPVTGHARLREILVATVEPLEQGADAPWTLEHAAHLERQLDAIVGFELRVRTLRHKAKFSQNRSTADRRGVIEALAGGNETERAVAERMRADLEDLRDEHPEDC